MQRTFLLISIVGCALVSGFTALGYQLCWIRLSTQLFGSTTSAVSTVVAVFFVGLALGGWFFGKISSRRVNIFLIYGLLEVGIGIGALLSFLLFGVSDSAFEHVYLWTRNAPSMLIAMRALFVFAIILPTAVLIGGTFPILCQISANVALHNNIVNSATLYSVNTLGSFSGCLVYGLFFIPQSGIVQSVAINVILSVVLGLFIFLFFVKRYKEIAQDGRVEFKSTLLPQVNSTSSLVKQKTSAKIFYCAACMSGFVALGLEVVWTRFLSLIVHCTAYTYVFSLGSILLGIALGSAATHWFKSRNSASCFAIVNILLGIIVSAILLLPVVTWNWVYDSKDLFLQAALCIAVFLVPSVLMGASFSFAMKMVQLERYLFGNAMGRLIFFNTLGGIAGSLCAGFFLLPFVGMHAALAILTNTSILIGIITLFSTPNTLTLFKKALVSCMAFVVWLCLWCFSGVHLPHDFLSRNGRVVAVCEGVSSFLSVVKKGSETRLEIDGMWQGQKSKGYQILSAHIPMLLHPNPKKVLVVGVGTGQSAQRFLMYNINRLDCADIEIELPKLIRGYFNGDWLDDSRVSFLPEDGRTIASYGNIRYDIISIEAGQTFRPQVASLYSVDFYQKVKRSLCEDGLVSQFVPVGFLTQMELASVIRSFLDVFPYSTLWNNKYAEFILVGSMHKQPILTKSRLDLLSICSVLNEDLSYSFSDDSTQKLNTPQVFSALYLMGQKGLASIAQEGILYRDNRPDLEYRSATIPYSPSRFHSLIERHLDCPDSIVEKRMQGKNTQRVQQMQLECVRMSLDNY